MPDKTVAFTLKKDDFAKMQKAATTLNLPDIVIKGDVRLYLLLQLIKRINLQTITLLILVKQIKSLQLILNLKTLK